MKKALRIAQLELGLLFYSPIAWLLLIVLIVQSSLEFTGMMERLERSKEMHELFSLLTWNIYCSPFGGLLPGVLGNLYLYVPLITMGLMSREVSSGTFKLLYSSPVKVRQIVYGKFLAMMGYCLALIAALVLFVATGAIMVPHFGYAHIAVALLGIYLLLCTYSAIGLFMSCLTSYQVVAAISTFAVFAFLSYVGSLGQGIDIVRDLTHNISLTNQVYNMIDGLLTTRDVCYFVIITLLFLGLAIFRLRMAREIKPVIYQVLVYTLLPVFAVVAGYLTSRPGYIGYYDSTATQMNTLSENTQKILQSTGDSAVTVTAYINFLDNSYFRGTPSDRNEDVKRWEPYLRFKSNIRLNYVYYYDSVYDDFLYKHAHGETNEQIAQVRAKANKLDLADFKTPDEIHRIINLKPEQNRYVSQVSWKGKATFLRVFNDVGFWPSETEIGVALKRLQINEPRIGFLEGGFERSIGKAGDQEYKTITSDITFRYALVNQGFNVDSVDADTEDIPTGLAALVIADPRTPFTPQAVARIQRYIDAGGNLLIAGEPGKQSVLNPLLHLLGVQMKEGTLVQRSRDYSPDLLLAYLTPAAAGLSQTLNNEFEDSMRLSMPGAAALVYDSAGPFTVKPLVMTDPSVSWNKRGPLVTDSADVVFTPAEGDEQRAFPTALCLTRKKGYGEQRIVVTGDADFMSNTGFARNGMRTANFSFITTLFGWFSNGLFPIDTSKPRSQDTQVRITDSSVWIIKVLFLGVIPGILLVTGTVLLIRRKRK
jgi:ABC-2 type transport system permease protein